MKTRLSVSKWQGTGNDFVLLHDLSTGDHPYAAIARALCDRRFGIGADGVIALLPPRDSTADLAMRIFNADGSEAEMCGNGIRCVALAYDRGSKNSSRELSIATPAGIVHAQVLQDGLVRVNMGKPRLRRRDIPMAGPPDEKAIGVAVEIAGSPTYVCAVSFGNPHCVVFVEDVAQTDIAALAATLNDESLFPRGVNVEIASLKGQKRITMRVFERGVGETWACGSGACAVAVAAILTGRAQSPVELAMRGGEVTVDWDGKAGDVFLTGPAKLSFRTEIELDV